MSPQSDILSNGPTNSCSPNLSSTNFVQQKDDSHVPFNSNHIPDSDHCSLYASLSPPRIRYGRPPDPKHRKNRMPQHYKHTKPINRLISLLLDHLLHSNYCSLIYNYHDFRADKSSTGSNHNTAKKN